MITPHAVLRLDGVTAGYRDASVLRDVTIEVSPSSVVALIGPNGAGKSTLLKVASGQIRATSGTVSHLGQDVSRVSTYNMARRGLCHVPEGRGIFPSLSVRRNLLLFARKRGEKAAIEQAISAFPPLSQLLDRVAGSLSGGEQQMLALARAYISHPNLVLVDEASMGLAPLVVDMVFEFLANVAKEGTALLIVEQYIGRVLAIAERAYVLTNGAISYAGPATALLDEDVFDQYFGLGEESAVVGQQ